MQGSMREKQRETAEVCLNCTKRACPYGECAHYKRESARIWGIDPGRQARQYEARGERHTLREWDKISGIDKGILSSRINKRGWSVEKAITTPIQRETVLTADGKTRNIQEWAQELHMTRQNINNRLRQGWTIEQIIAHYGGGK